MPKKHTHENKPKLQVMNFPPHGPVLLVTLQAEPELKTSDCCEDQIASGSRT
jgi:hypothetical protein